MTTLAMQNKLAQLDRRLDVLESSVDLISTELSHVIDPGHSADERLTRLEGEIKAMKARMGKIRESVND